jgi:hypothetical protein
MMYLRRTLVSCVAIAAMGLTAASVEAKSPKGDKGSTSTFQLNLRAHFEQESVVIPTEPTDPVVLTDDVDDTPDTPEVEDESNEVKIPGTGTAVGQGPTMTLEIPTFTGDNGDTVSVSLAGPLTLVKKGKEYRGAGTITAVIGGVTHTAPVEARVKVRKNKKGEFAIVKIKPKSGRGLDFSVKVTGKGVVATGV